MASTIKCTLLSIPVELRLPIYDLIAHRDEDRDAVRAMLSVCRQIREEVFRVLMRESRNVYSLKKLANWATAPDANHLDLVRNISVNIPSSALQTLFNWYSLNVGDVQARSGTTPFTISWWEKQPSGLEPQPRLANSRPHRDPTN